MTSGYLGLGMLGLIVIAIMMGFPTAFTLMGLGMLFGYVAYFDPAQGAFANRVFDLMVQRTYGGMTNDTLLSIPLFVLMGYVIERAALVDKMFHAVQLSFRRLPASLAVATLIVCTFWGIASGIVGAVVVLMGVIAMRPMLKAGYDSRLAAGVITAGGTLGILIPPSVMIIVYAAVAGQSVVRLYAAAMIPGFLLAFLYFVYIVGWAVINPRIAPPLPDTETRVDLPEWIRATTAALGPHALMAMLKALAPSARARIGAGAPTLRQAVGGTLAALGPLLLAVAAMGLIWFHVVVHSTASDAPPPPDATQQESAGTGGQADSGGLQEPPAESDTLEEPPSEGDTGVREPPGTAPAASDGSAGSGDGEVLKELSTATDDAQQRVQVPEAFFKSFWVAAALLLTLMVWYYRDFTDERLQVQRLLFESVMPLAVLTVLVLVVILLGITTATESAAVGAAGAFMLAWTSGQLTWQKTREAVYLTAKTTAMVCWLFVGSALFSAVFALHGGQELIEKWILGMNLTPLQFLLLTQALIFFLGWPLEWTEIIVIFVPIFLPLLTHFNVDPILFGTLVAVNLQAAFLSPPVAMSAFYLKGVSPPHVTLNQIFAGMMPYMLIVMLCMVLMYLWPGMTLWLPQFLYGAS
jgi:TRAP-type mannitol/chloroaromatic compound transport system permease large subunit